MKSKINLQSFCILVILFFLSSCIKDDENIEEETASTPTGTGSFTYQGESYSTPVFDAVIYDEYSNDDYTGYDLTFYSTEMVLKKEDNWHYGDGNMITLSVISPDPYDLVPSSYVWDETDLYGYADTIIPNLLFYGSVYIHTKNLDTDITAGHAAVNKDGSDFSISYWVTLPGGDTIKGNYTGGYNHYNGNYW